MKRTIALISEHASPLATLGGVDSGGQNVYVAELARHLVNLEYKVDIYTRWDDPTLPEIIHWFPDVRIMHVQAGPVRAIDKEDLYGHMPAFTERMIDIIRSEGTEYDLIHANFWMSAMVASDLKKILRIPFVVTFHALGHIRKLYQGTQDKFPPERVEIEKQIVCEADQVIAECPQDKEDLIQYYQAPPSKITIIPCGFNPQEFYPVDRLLARRMLKINPDDFVVLQLGRIVPRKGIDNVIRAIGKLKQTATQVKLFVVGGESQDTDPGNNPEIARLQCVARESGVADEVIFTGSKQRDVLKYYYAAADIFVTTPWYEPFGITPLESMACGTPVIGSNVGGIKYSVEDGLSGFHVPPNDADALAIRIYELMHDDQLRKAMREKALTRVNSLFTWAKVAEKVAALYERILLGTRPQKIANEDAFRIIHDSFQHAAETFLGAQKQLAVPILQVATVLVNCFREKNKVLICGNGGSAAESQHFAAELIGRFEVAERKALPAIALTADNAVLTAWANDFSFDNIFARQVEALGQKGDVLICMSTSGESSNIVNAMKAALEKGMTCVAFTGKGGGSAAAYAQVNLIIPSNNTQRIQELHLHIIHTLCSLIEENLFKKKKAYPRGARHYPGLNGNATTRIPMEKG